jgi:cobalt-zinc-cadmium efflux system outer membrane protein
MLQAYVVLFALILAGCSLHPLRYEWPESGPLGRDLAAYTPPKELDNEIAVYDVEPEGTLTLRDAMALALLHNPGLRGFAWEVRAAEARALQASLPPNPEMGLEVENIAGSGGLSGTKAAETTLSLSQVFLLDGKLDKRIRLASLDRKLSTFEYEARRIDVLTVVTKRFIELLAATRRVGFTKQALSVAEHVLLIAQKRVQAGDASPVERTRASLTVATTRLAVKRAEREVEVARIHLAATWGGTESRFQTVTGTLDAIADIPDVKSLIELIGHNPDIARWAIEMARRNAALELAKAQATTDIEAEIGFRHLNESDDTALTLGISFPLQAFDRNQGGIQEARFNIAKASQEQRAAVVQVTAYILAAYQQLAAAQAEAVALKNEVLPAAQSSLDATREAFKSGKLGFIEVVDVERTLIDIQFQYVEALSSYHKAVADVERLIGHSLSDLPTPQDQPEETLK